MHTITRFTRFRLPRTNLGDYWSLPTWTAILTLNLSLTITLPCRLTHCSQAKSSSYNSLLWHPLAAPSLTLSNNLFTKCIQKSLNYNLRIFCCGHRGVHICVRRTLWVELSYCTPTKWRANYALSVMEIVDKHQHKQRKLVLSPSVKTVDLYGYVALWCSG